jgi:pyridoxamine 5'-phosphate oxidase
VKAGKNETVASDPFPTIRAWLDKARALKLVNYNAMTLATSTADGQPSARIVLLKELRERGLVFHTNYLSRKGRELTVNPRAAAVLWWRELERQIRVEGTVRKLDPAESDAYFASRPRGSQLGAWASEQSAAISGRDELERRLEAVEQQYRNATIPRPPHWGGFELVADGVELWVERSDRLHERTIFCHDGAVWRSQHLAP